MVVAPTVGNFDHDGDFLVDLGVLMPLTVRGVGPAARGDAASAMGVGCGPRIERIPRP